MSSPKSSQNPVNHNVLKSLNIIFGRVLRPCRSDTARLEYSHQTKCRPASEMSHTLSTLTLHCSPLYILIRINRIFILVTIQPKIEPLKVSSIGGQPMRWLPNVDRKSTRLNSSH